MDEGGSQNQIIYIKYKEEENLKKTLLSIKDEEKIAEITTIEERRIDMVERVGEEHIYENLKSIGRTGKSKLDPLYIEN